MYALTNKFPHYGEVVFKRFNSRMTVPVVDLGMRPALLTCEPKNIQAILATNFNGILSPALLPRTSKPTGLQTTA